MPDEATIVALSHEDLVKLVLKLYQENQKQAQENQALRQQIEELTRKQHRSATPFSKGKPKADPKPPGRNPGQGPFTRRSAPPPESYTTITDVLIQTSRCPSCGGALKALEPELVTITDLEELPRPTVLAWRIGRAHCCGCARHVRAQHAEVAADQRGATAHQMGRRLLAVGHWLHYSLGVPQRKLPGVFRERFGVKLTQSALRQSAQRLTDGLLSGVYESLRKELSQSRHVHSDDTGWSIKGKSAWLMGFSNATTVVYQIRWRHRSQELQEIIGEKFQEVLSSDRFGSYNAAALAGVRQQKCLAHIQRNIPEHLQTKRGRSCWFAEELRKIFGEALALWHRYHDESSQTEQGLIQREAERLRHHLRDWRLVDPGNQRLLDGLGWHDDRGNLLRFLDDWRIPPTNNQAERDLRGAVIAPKVSHCSASDSRAESRSVLMSIFATLKRRGVPSMVGAFCQVIATGLLPGLTTTWASLLANQVLNFQKNQKTFHMKNVITIPVVFAFAFMIWAFNLIPGSYNDFNGTIDSIHQISMSLYIEHGDSVKGHYFYNENEIKIPIKGIFSDSSIELNEFGIDGNVRALFKGKISKDKTHYITGVWNELVSGQSLSFSLSARSTVRATWGHRYESIGAEDDTEVEEFAKKIKRSILDNDFEWLSGHVAYPIAISINGNRKKITNRQAFKKYFPITLNSKIIERIRTLPTTDLFVTDNGATIDNGQIWIDYTPQKNNEDELLIIAINY